MTLAPRVSDKLEIIAQMCDYVVGIDTHAKKHVYAVVSSNGGLLETRSYDADNTGIIKAIKWVANKYGQNVKFAVEGTSSYGEILCVLLQKSGYEVFEAKPPAKKTRVNNGKTDEIDALAAARSILDMKVIQLIKPRSQGNRKALRTLFDYRRFLTGKLTAAKNSLTAQVRGIDIGIDARNTLKTSQYKQIAGFRENRSDNFEQGIARQIAKSMAKEILDTIQKLKENEEQMKQIITELCPEILEFKGCGPVSAAIIICAYSHKGRIKSREAFAKLAGCAPIPASSGNTSLDDLTVKIDGRPPEPSSPHLDNSVLEVVDVILAPGVAVDMQGNRLGHGGGWYDRILAAKRPEAKVFALLYDTEVYYDELLPTEEHDQKVNGIITQSQILRIE